MTDAETARRLPTSLGKLVDLAGSAYAARFRLYAALAGTLFVLCTIVEFAWPGALERSVGKTLAEGLLQIGADAFIVTAVALGIGTRVAGETPPARAILAGARDRWLPVLGALAIVQVLVLLTLRAGALAGPVSDPTALLLAPVAWLFWGAIALAGPVTALSADRPALALVTGFGRAVMLSLRVANLGRLAVVAFATVMPLLLGQITFDLLSARGIAHAAYFANIPIDAIAVGPLAALQTVFALDFARRAGTLGRSS